MNNKKIFAAKCFVISLLMASLSLCAYHLNVTNNTPFPIEVKCKKRGIINVHSERIEPNQKGEVGCGGADCQNGIKVKILGKNAGWKDIEFENGWGLQCSSADISVVAIPQLEKHIGAYDQATKTEQITYSIKSFKIAIVRDLEVTAEIVPFMCTANK